jgi:hypothetical protein
VSIDDHVVAPEVIVRLAREQARSNGPGSGYAVNTGHLNVFNELWIVYLLTPSGDVLIADDVAGTLVPATPRQREIAYLNAARRHPELRALSPVRPPGAPDCPVCHGTGSPATALAGQPVLCGEERCNSRGWWYPG